MNLAEFPLAVLSTRSNGETKTLEFTDTLRLRTGEIVERQWTITGADKFGLPTSTDDDVILGLMCLTMDQGFRDRKVYFSRYELLRILRWSTEGRSYQRLSKSLDRLSGVRIRAANAFFDNAAKAFQTCNFGVIDAYELNDSRAAKSSGPEAKSFFIWSEVMFDSFRAGFIKKIDLDFYFGLKSAVSRRLYRYLDKHFYHRSVVEKPLLFLAFEKLGLSRSYQYVSSVKQQIEPACEELIKRGFIRRYEYLGKGATTVVRFISPAEGEQPVGRIANSRAGDDVSVLQIFPPEECAERRVIASELVSRGLSDRQAAKLLSVKEEGDFARVRQILGYFDRIVQSTKAPRNKVGFLYRAIEDSKNFSLPEEPKPVIRREFRVVEPPADQGRREEYQRYLAGEVARYKRSLGEGDRRSLYDGVEQKLACLRGILEHDRFREAVEGCVRDEVVKQCNLPDYRTWVESHLKLKAC